MNDEWLTTIDVSTWPDHENESRGVREKVWLAEPDGDVWLRKCPLLAGSRHRPFEPAIETVALGIARAAGLEAAYGRPCTWQDPGTGTERRGIIVRRFLERGREELHAGLELLRGRDSLYNPADHGMHTLARCRDALVDEEQRAGVSLVVPFVDMLIYDAWVGNGDRHQENWSLIRTQAPPTSRLAPIYDVAACFGAELLDDNKLLTREDAERLRAYVEGCPSGFGHNKFHMRHVVAEAREWPEWAPSCQRLLPRFRTLLGAEIPQWLAILDDSLLPPVRKEFLLCMLELRLAWVEARQ